MTALVALVSSAGYDHGASSFSLSAGSGDGVLKGVCVRIKIGINGFGRIGKMVARAALYDGAFQIVGINDLMSAGQIAAAMIYDSTHGKFTGTVQARENSVVVNGQEIPVTAHADPAAIPWSDYGGPIVLESTDQFTTAEKLEMHLRGGAQKVLLGVPPQAPGEKIKVIVFGINHQAIKADDQLVSNASCTTNCLAPVVKVLQASFGITKGLITTVHAYTNRHQILDHVHIEPRRARAAACSIIPTTTGAGRVVGQIIPELAGRIDGTSLRVPIAAGAAIDFVALLATPTTEKEINLALKHAAENELKGILRYEEEAVISTDIIGDPSSSIVDAQQTMMTGANMVKILAWYDNEWGYSCRCLDLFKLMAA
jgi:glyceraldehyde 3-phosphate dehydrogenase